MNLLVTLSLAMVQCAAISYCCVCMPYHPQLAFKRADFVVELKVISDRKELITSESLLWEQMGLPAFTEVSYTVQITEVFKGRKIIKSLRDSSIDADRVIKSTVYTSAGNFSCGRNFDKGAYYVISGRVIEGRMKVGACDWAVNKQSKDLSSTMAKGLKSGYRSKCEVVRCMQGWCDKAPNAQGICNWEVEAEVDECFVEHRLCEEKDDQGCQWSRVGKDVYTCSLKRGSHSPLK